MECVGTFFFVPAVVWQELHSFATRPIITSALHAKNGIDLIFKIHYNDSSILFGQAEADRKPTIIEIFNNDDEIINTCLLIKQNMGNVILLTADGVLKIKAYMNSIDCFGLQDVIDAGYDEKNLNRRFH